MDAVLIGGSPRNGGNTHMLLSRCADHLKRAGINSRLIQLSEVPVKPCRACGGCRELADRRCTISDTDDNFNDVFKAMCDSQIIITGSPVYFGSATPEMMALLDRAGYVSRANGNVFSRKIGGPITVARRAGQNFTYAQLMYWYMINDMIVPGSSYWNVAFGREPGDVANDAEGLATVDRFMENIIWLADRLF